jgi:hypothetical protein
MFSADRERTALDQFFAMGSPTFSGFRLLLMRHRIDET